MENDQKYSKFKKSQERREERERERERERVINDAVLLNSAEHGRFTAADC